MLVLSRKLDQSIIIGDNIKIEVLKIKGNTIRLGISAPQDVKVLRGELAPYEVKTDSQASKSAKQSKTSGSLTIDVEIEDDGTFPNPFVVAQAV